MDPAKSGSEGNSCRSFAWSIPAELQHFWRDVGRFFILPASDILYAWWNIGTHPVFCHRSPCLERQEVLLGKHSNNCIGNGDDRRFHHDRMQALNF